MEYLICPICGDENTEVKPCARKASHLPLSYTFRCTSCSTRVFLTEETHERLTEAGYIELVNK